MASRSKHNNKPIAAGLSDCNPNSKKPAPPPVKPVSQHSSRNGSRKSGYWVPMSGPSNKPAAAKSSSGGVLASVEPSSSNKPAGTGRVFYTGSYPEVVPQFNQQMDNYNYSSGEMSNANVYKLPWSQVVPPPPRFVPVAINRRRGGTGVFIPHVHDYSTTSTMIYGSRMNAKKLPPSPIGPSRMNYNPTQQDERKEVKKQIDKASASSFEASLHSNEPLNELIPLELLLPEEWPY